MPAGGALRPEGDMQRAGEDPGGARRPAEHGQAGSGRAQGGAAPDTDEPRRCFGRPGDSGVGQRPSRNAVHRVHPRVQPHPSQGNQTFLIAPALFDLIRK